MRTQICSTLIMEEVSKKTYAGHELDPFLQSSHVPTSPALQYSASSLIFNFPKHLCCNGLFVSTSDKDRTRKYQRHAHTD